MELYGFDAEAGLPDETDEGGIVVPETICPLGAETLILFRQNIQAIQQGELWNVQPYLHAVRTLKTLIDNRNSR